MTTVSPSPSFYLGPDAGSPILDITGVHKPLSVRNSNLRIVNTAGEELLGFSTDPTLSANSDLYVPTQRAMQSYIIATTPSVDPPIYAVGGVLRLQNSVGAIITEASVDGALTTDSDTKLPTEHAVKMYVDNHSGGTSYIISVSAPLAVALGDLSIPPAGAAATGTVTAAPQTFGGDKTFSGKVIVQDATVSTSSITGSLKTAGGFGCAGEAYISAGVSMDVAPGMGPFNPYVRATQKPLEIFSSALAWSQLDSSMLRVSNVLTGGDFEIFPAIGKNLAVYSGVGGSLSTRVSQTLFESLLPLSASLLTSRSTVDINDGGGAVPAEVRSTVAGKPLSLVATSTAYDSANTARVVVQPAIAGGCVLLQPANLCPVRTYAGSTPQFIAHEVAYDQITEYLPVQIISSTAPQLTITHSLGNNLAFLVDSGGDTIIVSTGADLSFHSVDKIHVLNTTQSTSLISGALTVNGGIGMSGAMYGQNVHLSNVVLPQLSIGYDDATQLTVGVSNGGSTAIAVPGATLSVSTQTAVRLASTLNAISTATGSLHTEGGLSCVQDAWIGGVVNFASASSGSTINFPAIAPSAKIINATCTSGGTASISIDISGDTQINTSGNFYVNGNLFAPIISQDSLHNLLGAAAGHSVTATYQKVGRTVTAHFPGILTMSVGAASIYIAPGTLIPTAYRPIRVESAALVVVNQTGLVVNNFGRYQVWPTGELYWYAGPNLDTFVSSNNVGWVSFTAQWLGT